MNFSHYYHTIRYLKPHQIVAQARNRLRLKLENPSRFGARPAPDFPGCIWKPALAFLPPGAQRNRTTAILQGKMTFINQEYAIGWMPDWGRADLPKLWLYNLNYFEWLWAFDQPGDATDFETAKSVVRDWICRHTLSRGQQGWEPYPVSLRLMNWCPFFYGAHHSQTLDDAAFNEHLWDSIRLQADWLAAHLEDHLLGNHLLENAAALTLTGACFDGPAAKRWMGVGLKLLQAQTREQILSDGMHFERSSMYHARVVHLFLMLRNTGNPQLRQAVDPVLPKMLKALAALCHPDEEIALLNDSALGIYNEPGELFAYAVRMGLVAPDAGNAPHGAWSLPEAGYYGYRGNDGTYIVCDAGPIGPDYIPGHAHADTFSFELSLKGCRVIVDSGVHDYEKGEMRSYCRSTRAHNTVEIEGQDQSEMWDAFRVARRAYPHDATWAPQPDGFQLTGRHDGYMRLNGRPVHHRTFSYREGGKIEVVDRVESERPVQCRSMLHLHPECICTMIDKKTASIQYPAGSFRISYSGRGLLECRDGIYCPEFNVQQKNQVLLFSWTSSGSSAVKYTIETQS
ncbi:MAG: alginate lyase family protein [Deltaproteobacteria bacterium]|nr:alginate lyase family protein [Deltaproteobacteria bacterium]